MRGHLQLRLPRFDREPEMALLVRLSAIERGRLYDELGLAAPVRAMIEAEVRARIAARVRGLPS